MLKTNIPLACALLTALSMSMAASESLAQEWQQLGPDGGFASYLAASPTDAGTAYAAVGPRIFASIDSGVTWIERTPAPECPSPLSLQVRSGGDIFINCYHRNLRSRDGGLSWSTYSPTSRLLTDFRLSFDPHQPSRAAVRRALNYVWHIATTSDDGITWTAPVPGPNDVVPTYVAFDPIAPGRLIGVATESRRVDSTTEYLTRLHESRDDGAHWTPVSVISAQGARPCYEREFLVARDRRLFLLADCGFLRSGDGGVTWESMPRAIDLGLTQFQWDNAGAGRLLALDGGGQLHESRDAAVSWQPLPAHSRAVAFTTTANGTALASTEDGVFALAPGAIQWAPRTAGLHARPLNRVEAAGTANTVLTAWSFGMGRSPFRSVNGGASWVPYKVDGRALTDITRSLHDANAVFARTDDGALHASTDAGLTWALVNARPSADGNDRIAGIVAVPGVLYGLAFEPCGANLLPVPCSELARSVASSIDGGKSWSRVAGGLDFGQGGSAYRIVANAANPAALMVQTSAGLLATFDGGARFTNVLATGGWVSADPLDAFRWYAIGPGGKLLGTTDGGGTWNALVNPPAFAGRYDLLVDPHDPRRLYAIGERGDVSASDDRGATWAIVVPPSLSLSLAPYAARIGPEATTTIYAGSGVVKIALGGASAPAVVRAVEYYRPAVDHYFVTADPQEIAKLDSGATAGWQRTGFGFDVLAATAFTTFTSPVCRFYGRPEKGLDSHFYSAAPAECQAVVDRFGDAWIFEASTVFKAYLPAASDGLCPSRTTPVYRLYNQRADVNHRYTMWPELRQNMLDAGWMSEGYGPSGVAMCVPW